MPRSDNRTAAPNVFGKPGVSYPTGSLAHPRIVEGGSISQSRAHLGMLTPHPRADLYPLAILTGQGTDPGDNTDANLRWEYTSLPGPYTAAPLHHEQDRGDVSSKSRIVASVTKVVAVSVVNAGSGGANGAATITGTTGTGTKFQASVTISGGAIASITAPTVAGLYTAPPIEPDEEPITGGGLVGATVRVTLLGTEQSSLSIVDSVATLIRYEPTDNVYLLNEITETWAVPGPLRTATEIDTVNQLEITTSKQLIAGAVNPSNDVDGTNVITISCEPSRYGTAVGEKTITTILGLPGAVVPGPIQYFEDRGDTKVTRQLVIKLGTEESSLIVDSNVATWIHYEDTKNTKLLNKFVETWAVPGPLRRTVDPDTVNNVVVTMDRQLVEAGTVSESNTADIDAGTATTVSVTASKYGIALDEVSADVVSGLPGTVVRGPMVEDFERGPVETTTQLIIATGGEEGSVTVNSGTVKETRYEPTKHTAHKLPQTRNTLLLHKVIETWLLATAKVITEKKVDPENGSIIVTTRKLKLASGITPGSSVTDDILTIIDDVPSRISNLISYEETTTVPKADQYDMAHALVEEEYRAFKFPAYVIFSGGATPAGDQKNFRIERALLCSHLVNTYWVNSTTKPDLPTINKWDDVETLNIDGTIFPNTLHDELLGGAIPATSPTATDYKALVAADAYVNVGGDVTMTRLFNRWRVRVIQVKPR